MGKRKAPYVKQALYKAAMTLLAEGKSINSFSLVARLRQEFEADLKKDHEDIFDIGLHVLAGRLTTLQLETDTTQDMFAKERLPTFFPLRRKVDGKVIRDGVPTRQLTPRMIEGQPPRAVKSAPKGNKTLKIAEQMINEGLMDMTIEDYLNR